MGNPPLIVGLFINGVAYAAIYMIVALVIYRFAGEFAWRSFLVLFLFIAAGLYIVFAVWAGEGIKWVVVELVGVAMFGGTALPVLRGSLWWLVAGWALHLLWDVGLHYLGPGRQFAPETYTIACLSFDLLVAAYIAISCGVGELRSLRTDAQPTLLHNLATLLVDEAEVGVLVAEVQSDCRLRLLFATIHGGPILLSLGPSSPSTFADPKGTAHGIGLLISSSEHSNSQTATYL